MTYLCKCGYEGEPTIKENPPHKTANCSACGKYLEHVSNKYDSRYNREYLYDKTFGYCGYCGVDIYEGFHIDHMHPRSRGGSDGLRNLIASCQNCNLSKGARTVEEFRRYKKCGDFFFEKLLFYPDFFKAKKAIFIKSFNPYNYIHERTNNRATT
jgi:CRISPR/Cas system Type II protein with McrA/HNH and RuvC-like nuclease domain